MCRPGWSTTAAATTGPARQPRPTSSTPATWQKPTRRNAFSSVRIAGTRTIATLCVGWRDRQDGVIAPPALLPVVLLLRCVLHARGLALQLAQVVQLRAAH